MPAERAELAERHALDVQRLDLRFESDDRRVITLPFTPGGEPRINAVMERVRQLDEPAVDQLLADTLARFGDRHRDLAATFEEHFHEAVDRVNTGKDLPRNHRLLVGAYFSMEYSFESAALFNPSIVRHPHQTGVDGGVRFIMSLRATGEGHVSSIVFRTGVIYTDGSVVVISPRPSNHRARLDPDQSFYKQLFQRKLREMGVSTTATERVLSDLPDRFSLHQLETRLETVGHENPDDGRLSEALQTMSWLARSNYQLDLPDDVDIDQVVIFPQSENESRGIEDLRLVEFVDDDGSITYFGTYTAWNGQRMLPQMIETTDFDHISIHTLNGRCVQNKGMALFPRKIGGHYVMNSRIDGENLYIMYSDLPYFWETAERLIEPTHPWELMQIGNCGSPIETDEGWILLTHGVGPMRQYCIGAMLLDLEDPMKVIGHLQQPLLSPTEEERAGYVPNVVYTCGAMVHGERLYIPYAMSDIATRMASVRMDQLIDRLLG